MNNKGKINSIMLVAPIMGVLALAGGENLSRILGLGEIAGTAFVALGCLIMGLVIGFIARSAATVTSLLLCSYAAILIGEFVDILIDWYFRSIDRNLWPLELIVIGVLAFIPVIIGIKVGRKLKARKTISVPNKGVHTDAG